VKINAQNIFRHPGMSLAGVHRWIPAFAGMTVFVCATFVNAIEVKPVINAQLLGGQYFYNNEENALGALASLYASPYLKFNDRWSLVPLYSGNYRGTKQAQDLIGGGTLFQDSQSHVFSVKGIRSFANGWKAKAITSYGWEWLRETTDEDWTKGLYDSRRLSLGTEAEYSWSPEQSVRMAYDYYRIRFPNYVSLESQSGAALGRELNQPNVLDNVNHLFTVAGQVRVIGGGLVEPSISHTLRAFGDQHVVVASGDLSSATRDDQITTFGLQGTWPIWHGEENQLLGGLGYGWTRQSSNQNSYDAQKLVFRPSFYDSNTHSLNTRWTLMGGDVPWSVSFYGALSRQAYSDRLIQNGEGLYGTDKTHVDVATLSWTVGYPIAKGFQLTANVYATWSDSNNTYTQAYQYHYHTTGYLAGFSYAF